MTYQQLFLRQLSRLLPLLTSVALLTESATAQSPEHGTSSERGVGAISGRTFSNVTVQFAIIDGMAVFEGDIILGTAEDVINALNEEQPDPTQTGPARSVVIKGSDYRWPNLTVAYDLDANIGQTQQTQITNAIAHWETNTPLHFVLRTAANQAIFPDFIHFINDQSRCASYVGRLGGQQRVFIATTCSTGSIIHEIGHAVGLWHEQSRSDRDQFITVNWQNITTDDKHNFYQHITDGDDVGPYDCESIMHYPVNAFSNGNGPTITPLDPTCQPGQRTALSQGDLLAVDVLYPGQIADPQLWINHYGYNQGWRLSQHVRVSADVNGDKQADIVGFGDNAVSVSLSTGGAFAAPQSWVNHYSYQQGWRVDRHVRLLADVNNDQKADIVGFGYAGTYVSLSTGTGFDAPQLWLGHFGYNQGWRVDRHIRVLADVNGDNRADVVGFGEGGASVSLSTGTGFTAPQSWVSHYGYDQGWRLDRHVRLLADVDSDLKADIIGFGYGGVFVSLSTGTGFAAPQLWLRNFGYSAGGWRTERHIRAMADVDGDGRQDVVGFGTAGVFVAVSTGTSFLTPQLWLDNYGYRAGGWRVDEHPRLLIDLNKDKRADIVGFGSAGVYISLSTGVNFGPPDLRLEAFGASAGNWAVSRHLRMLDYVDPNGAPHIIGFGNAGVYVAQNQLRP